jgi:hypothetical protein
MQLSSARDRRRQFFLSVRGWRIRAMTLVSRRATAQSSFRGQGGCFRIVRSRLTKRFEIAMRTL